MRRGLSDNVCGDQVYLALAEARPAGLNIRQLVAATKLSPWQVRRGLVFLRQFLAAQHLTPLIWDRRDGYRLSTDPADLIPYEKAHVRMELTRISRFIAATIDPHYALMPDDPWISRIHAQLAAVRSSLDIITELDDTGSPLPAPRRRRGMRSG